MSIPTFNSTSLVNAAARDIPSSPRVRVSAATLPGVNGQFVQLCGTEGRRITVHGLLEAFGYSPSNAHEALKDALRTRQALADGATVARYVGTDGTRYDNCIVESFEAKGEVQVSPRAGSFTASVPIEAKITQFTP